jgi:hypothetical protein
MKSKTQKRIEAEERSIDYESMTKNDKINKLNKGGFRAAKERKKLGEPEIPTNCTK